MRELKERAGLTYRDLEQRAEQAGHVLPRSTLATALSRDVLPRPELLRAFLIACGHADRVEVWTATRDRIAAGDGGGDGDGDGGVRDADGTADEAGGRVGARPWRRRLVPFAVGVPALAVLALGGHLVRADAGASGPAASVVAGPRSPSGPVEPGTYRIRAVGSGLCLGESTSRDGGGAVEQYACPTSVPVYVLEPAGGGQYTIRSLHPVLGHGCLGVDAGLRTDGARLMNDYCGRRGTAERFHVRAAGGSGSRSGSGSGDRAYLIQPVHTGACVSVPGGNRAPGAAVVQLPCTRARTGQLFAFDPVPAPTAVPDIRSN